MRHIQTPYGSRPLVYCDHTASGRGLASIEKVISRDVLPHYANTHSEASHTRHHTGQLRERARQTIKEVINAGPEDIVILCGTGATAAVNTLLHLLGLRSANIHVPPSGRRPLVLVGPYEHNSNELPWREALADVICLPLDYDEGIDQEVKVDTLAQNGYPPFIVGIFSAASNVTGFVSDVSGITRRLKDHGALAVWDYAAGAPYLAIDVNTPDAPCGIHSRCHDGKYYQKNRLSTDRRNQKPSQKSGLKTISDDLRAGTTRPPTGRPTAYLFAALSVRSRKAILRLRGAIAQRPAWYSGARRLLLCGPLWP